MNRFVINDGLKNYLSEIDQTRAKFSDTTYPAYLTQKEVFDIAQLDNQDAIETKFAPDFFNSINFSFYSMQDRAFPSEESVELKTGTGNYLALSPSVNFYFGAEVGRGRQGLVSILEIASGSRWRSWGAFALGLSETQGITGFNITATDFISPSFPDQKPKTILPMNVSIGEFNLLGDFDTLPEEKKYDAALITYGFDSIYGHGDVGMVIFRGQIFLMKYRLIVDSPDLELKTVVTNQLRQGQPLENIEHYQLIKREVYYEPADWDKIPYGELIKQVYGTAGADEATAVSIPGNALRLVEQAFERQLKSDGIFLIGEVGLADTTYRKESSLHAHTGSVALFRTDNYDLFKKY